MLISSPNYANGIKLKANVHLKVFKSSTSVPSLILIAHLLLLQASFFFLFHAYIISRHIDKMIRHGSTTRVTRFKVTVNSLV